MGLCFSKKKKKPSSNVDSPLHERNPPQNNPSKNQIKQVNEEESKVEPQSPKKIVVDKLKNSISTSQIETKEKPDKQEVEANTSNVLITANPVRTSSCTKEEVDAILLQCGRLSRNSSQKRKHLGSKRSFDFDNEKREEEEECVQVVSRPSPRRRTPSRERSGSKERGSQRRVSRSPNKRHENEKAKQQQPPMKIVSVPAREKGAVNKRNASPRSSSPSNCVGRVLNENNSGNQMSLSRSNSTKAEQFNFERNPMVEIDENLSKMNIISNVGKVLKSKEVEEYGRKAMQIQTQYNGIKSSHVQLKATELKNPKSTEKATELDTNTNPILTRTRSSRRSSRDLDNIISGTIANANTSNYTSFLLEDIQNYHKQNAGFRLPACVSKAHSILEAVADLNSSSSDQSHVKRGLNIEVPFVETEIHVNDDITEPTIHKYISVSELRKESEPQESAGSNSLVAHSWHSSWEFNSLDSTDRFSNTKCKGEEEAEESSNVGSREMRCRRGGSSISSGSSRLMSATKSSSSKKREVDQSRRVGVRKASSLLPVPTASS